MVTVIQPWKGGEWRHCHFNQNPTLFSTFHCGITAEENLNHFGIEKWVLSLLLFQVKFFILSFICFKGSRSLATLIECDFFFIWDCVDSIEVVGVKKKLLKQAEWNFSFDISFLIATSVHVGVQSSGPLNRAGNCDSRRKGDRKRPYSNSDGYQGNITTNA